MRSWTALACIGAMFLLLPVAAIAEEGQWAAPAEAPAEVDGFDDLAMDAPAADSAEEPLAEPASGEVEPMEAPAEVAGFDELEAPADPAALEPTEVPMDAPLAELDANPTEAAVAEADAEAGAWDAIEEPSYSPEEMGVTPAAQPQKRTALGPMAVDDEGRKGRIHTVAKGDTLWDISNAYLGTPWVWPSVWQDNEEIQNPHRISPDDRIWITAGQMRVVSESEANEMISAHDGFAAAPADMDPLDGELEPAEYVEGPTAAEDAMMEDDVPAAMDGLPVAVPLQAKASNDSGLTVRVAEREAMGFVTTESVDAATTIVESPTRRTLLVEGDMIYIGLGAGEVQVGDEFQIFRDIEDVSDVEGSVLLGYHVDVLGWAVVREITGDTSIAEIRMSHSDIRRGDRMVPREPVHLTVPIRFSPEGLPGNVVFLPRDRTAMGDGDYLYLNRGTLHGFEVGSAVEVFRSGDLLKDKATGRKVMTPDFIVGKLVVVAVRPDSSVAFIVRTSHELQVGDRVRPASRKLASN
jgi:hypothetical protein